AVLTDVMQQGLEFGNPYYPNTAKRIQGVAGELPFADVTADGSGPVIGGEAGETHGAGLNSSHDSSEGIVLAHGAGDDLLEVHADVLEEVFGKIAAVEANGLVGIVAVIVVPVEQCAGSFRCERERVHAQRAADIDLAGRREQVVAHHAHDGAGDHAEIFFHGGPALNGADFDVGLLHPLIDDIAEFGHLDQGSIGNAAGGHVFTNFGQLALNSGVIIFQSRDAPQ